MAPSSPPRSHALAALLSALLCASSAAAQAPRDPTTSTPRSSVQEFWDASGRGDYEAAAELLRAPGRNLADSTSLARQLRAVLDRFAVFDPDSLSDRPEGRLDDGLAPPFEELTRLGPPLENAPVRLTRLSSGRWVLSRDTVAHIPRWYAELDSRWLLERLPPWLAGAGPFAVARWQWAALPTLALAAALVGRALAWLALALLSSLVRPVARFARSEDRERLKAPARWLLGAGLFASALPALELPSRASSGVERLADATALLALGWTAWRAVDFGFEVLSRQAAAAQRSLLWGFGPLFRSLVRIVVVLVSAAAVLQGLGLPVASVAASLGLGGLAVALAARPSLENLLSAVMLAADQTLRVGDVVRIDGVYGTVEHIGLRSTRVRTLDRTLVSFPNGKLAELRIESYTARDRIRLVDLLRVDPATPREALGPALEALAKRAREHPRVHQDEVLVYLRELHELGLGVEVMLWLETTDWNEFVALRQEVLLALHAALEEQGVRLVRAFATGAPREAHDVDAPT